MPSAPAISIASLQGCGGPCWGCDQALLKFVPTPYRAQGASQLHIEGAVQRSSVEKHDAGGAFVPACPTFDFDDAAEDAALGITGSRIRDAGLAKHQLAQFCRYRENTTVGAYAGRRRGCRSTAFHAEKRRPLEAMIAVDGSLGAEVQRARAILARHYFLHVRMDVLAATRLLACARGRGAQQQTKHAGDRSGQTDSHGKDPPMSGTGEHSRCHE